MAFSLAEAFVQLTSRGLSAVLGDVATVKGALGGLGPAAGDIHLTLTGEETIMAEANRIRAALAELTSTSGNINLGVSGGAMPALNIDTTLPPIQLDTAQATAQVEALTGRLIQMDAQARIDLKGPSVGPAVAGVGQIRNAVNTIPPAVNAANNSMQQLLTGPLSMVGNMMAQLAARTGQFLMSSVGSFYEAEDAGAKLEAIVRATGGAAGFTADEMKKMAADLQDVTTFSDDATASAMSWLATFKNIRGDQFHQAIKGAQDLAAETGGDLMSATTQLAKALNDPVGGIGALSRAGVQFTDSQKAMIKSMVEVGDVAGAQNVILAELRGQVGGSAEAAAKAGSGPFKQFMNVLDDIKELIGGALAPALQSVFGLIGEGFRAAMAVVEPFKGIIAAVSEWIGGPMIAAGIALVGVLGIMKISQMAYNTALAVQAALTGNWAALAAAGIVTAAGLVTAYNAATEATEANNEAKKIGEGLKGTPGLDGAEDAMAGASKKDQNFRFTSFADYGKGIQESISGKKSAADQYAKGSHDYLRELAKEGVKIKNPQGYGDATPRFA